MNGGFSRFVYLFSAIANDMSHHATASLVLSLDTLRSCWVHASGGPIDILLTPADKLNGLKNAQGAPESRDFKVHHINFVLFGISGFRSTRG